MGQGEIEITCKSSTNVVMLILTFWIIKCYFYNTKTDLSKKQEIFDCSLI